MEQDFSTRTHALVLEPSVSWSAVFAGAVTAVAVSILLTLLAAGFGVQIAFGGVASHSALTAFTPTFGAAAVGVQVISAGLGGYLAGRMRHAWTLAHTDEAHFRDTAHGLITWALATTAGAVLAVTVLTPYAERLAAAAMPAVDPAMVAVDPVRAANVAAQSALFTALGMLISAFVAAVAARLGGMRSEEMHLKVRN